MTQTGKNTSRIRSKAQLKRIMSRRVGKSLVDRWGNFMPAAWRKDGKPIRPISWREILAHGIGVQNGK